MSESLEQLEEELARRERKLAESEKLVREAGFKGFKMLDIKSMTNLFYAATP